VASSLDRPETEWSAAFSSSIITENWLRSPRAIVTHYPRMTPFFTNFYILHILPN